MKKCLKPKKMKIHQRDEKKLTNWYAKTYEKLQKAKGSQRFISECLANNIEPKFATAPKICKTFFQNVKFVTPKKSD